MKAVVALILGLNTLMLFVSLGSTFTTQEKVATIESQLRGDTRAQQEADILASRLVPVIEKHLSPLLESPDSGETHAEALFDRILPLLTEYISRTKEPVTAEESVPIEYL